MICIGFFGIKKLLVSSFEIVKSNSVKQGSAGNPNRKTRLGLHRKM